MWLSALDPEPAPGSIVLAVYKDDSVRMFSSNNIYKNNEYCWSGHAELFKWGGYGWKHVFGIDYLQKVEDNGVRVLVLWDGVNGPPIPNPTKSFSKEEMHKSFLAAQLEGEYIEDII